MDSNYKMTQTDTHEFAIHDKPGGALRATITRDPAGGWATTLPEGATTTQAAVGDTPSLPDPQPTPQAAFDAFVQSVTPATDS